MLLVILRMSLEVVTIPKSILSLIVSDMHFLDVILSFSSAVVHFILIVR